MKIKDRVKPSLPPVEPGVYMAVCVGVVDLGEQYSEVYKNYHMHKSVLLICFSWCIVYYRRR